MTAFELHKSVFSELHFVHHVRGLRTCDSTCDVRLKRDFLVEMNDLIIAAHSALGH